MKDKRELLINAAYKVFSEKGYYNAKMEEIAEEAGVGKGTVYSYFDNKKDLFDTMVFSFLEEYFIRLEKGVNENDSMETIINKFLLNHMEILISTKATFMKVMTDFSNIPRNKEEIKSFHKKFIIEKTERYMKIFEKAKEKGELRDINPFLAANFFLGALKGVSESIIVFDEVTDKEKIAREVTDLLCYGIGKRSGN